MLLLSLRVHKDHKKREELLGVRLKYIFSPHNKQYRISCCFVESYSYSVIKSLTGPRAFQPSPCIYGGERLRQSLPPFHIPVPIRKLLRALQQRISGQLQIPIQLFFYIGGLFNCNGKTDKIHKNVLQVK